MGIVRPRPAIRKRTIKFIESRLALHAELMRRNMADGMEREEASRVAYNTILEMDRKRKGPQS